MAGTTVQVTLRNQLGDTLVVRGLRARGEEPPAGTPNAERIRMMSFAGDSLVIAPHAVAVATFTPKVPGSYFYYGNTYRPGWSAKAQPLRHHAGADAALVGVLIVDPVGETPDPRERIFLISQWADSTVPESFRATARFMINGRSWPHTERLTHAQGDSVRWRVINSSTIFHPMHLHGFYFDVSEWNGPAGNQFPARRVVTQPVPAGNAIRMTWLAEEPGNWLFHCHLMRHMSVMQGPPLGAAPGHNHAEPAGVDLMAGLVMGVTVQPAPRPVARGEVMRRQLRLHIGRREGVFGDKPGYGLVLQEGASPPAPDSVQYPSSTIELTRGEPSELVVRNNADVPLGVHWHGLELESRGDGVPGWSGMPGHVVPAIPPGDSLIVRLTPKRAGTFMYHAHSEPGHQLSQGLYGAFLVREPGAPRAPETERLFMLGSIGAEEDAPPAVNGRREPGPQEFRVGTTYRLRFMHVTPDDNKWVRLLDGEQVVQWRRVAIDGADLAERDRTIVPANKRFFDTGTTFDVEWTPMRAGELTLRIITEYDPGAPAFPRPIPEPVTTDIPMRVR
jgi:FtsP/CotA-like multicopper oxidase with cupredoxin domain